MTLPLFDSPVLSRLVRLLGQSGTTADHTECVNVRAGGVQTSIRMTAEGKAEFERLRVDVPDEVIWAAYQQRRKWQADE